MIENNDIVIVPDFVRDAQKQVENGMKEMRQDQCEHEYGHIPAPKPISPENVLMLPCENCGHEKEKVRIPYKELHVQIPFDREKT